MRLLEQMAVHMALPRRRVTLLTIAQYVATLGGGILIGLVFSERISVLVFVLTYNFCFWTLLLGKWLLNRDAERAMDEVAKYDQMLAARLARFRRELNGEATYLQ